MDRYAVVLLASAWMLSGCEFLGGAAVGAAGTSGAYEYQNKEALEDLDEQFERGEIDRDEYLRRKQEIDDRSVVY